MKRTVLTPALSATALLLTMQAAHAGPQAHVYAVIPTPAAMMPL